MRTIIGSAGVSVLLAGVLAPGGAFGAEPGLVDQMRAKCEEWSGKRVWQPELPCIIS